MVNRYYTSTSAQFLSVDPMLGSTHQPYAYAGGDPLNATDPLGLEWYWLQTTPDHKNGWNTFQGNTYDYVCDRPHMAYGAVGGGDITTGAHCGSPYCPQHARCTQGATQRWDDASAAYLNSEASVVENAYSTAWAKANQASCSSTTPNTPVDVTSCTVPAIVQAKGFSGCATSSHGGGCYTQWYSVGETVTPQNHIWVTKNTLLPLGSMDGCEEGAVIGGVAASEGSEVGITVGAVGGCVVGAGADYVIDRFADWLGSL